MLVHQQWSLHASRVETNRIVGTLATIKHHKNYKHVHQKMCVVKSQYTVTRLNGERSKING